jgi:predicted esterase
MLLLSVRAVAQQTAEEFLIKTDYLLFLPEGYDADDSREWPLILFLHGAGERGDSLAKVKVHGPPKLVEQRPGDFPFIIASPQCPAGRWWSTEVLIRLLDELIATYRVDESRVYLTGLSMGGFGTWNLAMEAPGRFAAIAPICGGGDPERVWRLRHTPAWVFHGAQDKVVPLQASEQMVEALRSYQPEVKFTIYPEAGHDSWTETYDNPELYQWLLSHRRYEPEAVPLEAETIAAYAGTWKDGEDRSFRISVDEEKEGFWLQAEGQPRLKLLPAKGGGLFVPNFGLEVKRLPAEAKLDRLRLYMPQMNQPMEARRVASPNE